MRAMKNNEYSLPRFAAESMSSNVIVEEVTFPETIKTTRQLKSTQVTRKEIYLHWLHNHHLISSFPPSSPSHLLYIFSTDF